MDEVRIRLTAPYAGAKIRGWILELLANPREGRILLQGKEFVPLRILFSLRRCLGHGYQGFELLTPNLSYTEGSRPSIAQYGLDDLGASLSRMNFREF